MKTAVCLTLASCYYRDVLSGIIAYGTNHPELLIESIGPSYDKMAELESLIASINTPPILDLARRWPGRVINVSGIFPYSEYPSVRVDNDLVGKMAFEHFRRTGLEHFAFLGRKGILVSDEREAAFQKHATLHGFSVKVYHEMSSEPFDPYYHSWPLTENAGKWLSGLPKPFGILCPNDLWACCVIKTCKEVGLQIPEQVLVLGVDNDELFCEAMLPKLSSIELSGLKAGWKAAELASSAIPVPQDLFLIEPVGVVVRGSTSLLVDLDPRMREASQFIFDNACRGLSVSEVVSHLRISRRTAERKFLASYGTSIGDYIRQCQFDHAKSMLLTTDLPIKVVASRTGFTGTKHLTSVFRHRLETTPTEFRLENREGHR